MFVVCDSLSPLSECYFFRGSYVESLKHFHQLNPNVRSVCVYKDLYGRCKLSDLEFVSHLKEKQFSKILSI